MEVTFRPVDASDVLFLARYAAHCGGLTDPEETTLEDRFRQLLEHPGYVGIMASRGPERLGFVNGLVEGQRLILWEIYMAERHQRQGIGRKLNEV